MLILLSVFFCVERINVFNLCGGNHRGSKFNVQSLMFKVSKFQRFKVLIIILTVLLFSKCNNTRYLKQGEILLHKNKIKIESGEKFVKKFVSKSEMIDDLSTLYKQKPNKSFPHFSNTISFFKFKLSVFNHFNKKNENKWRWWWKNKVGEPPVIFDSVLTLRTARNMENYLYNKGYLYPQVAINTKISKKRAGVTYLVKPNEIYTIHEVIFPQPNDELSKIIKENSKNSLLKSGNQVDLGIVRAERERISNDFRNQGYHNFNKEFIYFDIDSSETTKEWDLYLKIHYPEDSGTYRIYYINNVFIYTDYSSEKNSENIKKDTLTVNDYTFIGPSLRIKPEIILDDVFLKKGERYSLNNYQLTINRLSDMGIFKFVDVLFKPNEQDSILKNHLDCYIYLVTGKKQEITLEGEVSTGNESYLGLAGKFTYRNKNLLNRADMFVWNLNAGVETQYSHLFKNSDSLVRNVDFNNQFNLYLSEFLFGKEKWFSKQFNPKTRLSIGYNSLRRVDLYNLNSINFQFGYDWKEFSYKRHNLNPFNLNFVQVNKKTNLFEQKLNANPLLKNSFVDQVIIGSAYIFNYSNQQINQLKNFVFFRANIDVAGLIGARPINVISDWVTNDFKFIKDTSKNPKTIAGVPFAQYARVDIDFRHYNIFNNFSTFVTRFAAGVGAGYCNSSVMPYIKQYFVGGPYSVRAWRARELGPGSYQDTTNSIFPDQTGDMKLEMNAEFRFKIIGAIRGALFVDAGNVWTVRKGETRDGASFTLNDFYKEIGIGSGMGIRLDFTFFIIRLDFAYKLRDPSLLEKDRWLLKNFNLKNPNFNLAIGYPF